MKLQPYKVEFIVLAIVVTVLGITAWARQDWAAPIPPTETVYGSQHLNVY
jgi:hypothetical protein